MTREENLKVSKMKTTRIPSGAGELDDQAWNDHYPSLIKDDKAHTRSISDENAKRKILSIRFSKRL